MPAEAWENYCKITEYSEPGLARLAEIYQTPGPAFEHFLGVMLELRTRVLAKLAEGSWTAHGEDLTPYNRAALWLLDELITYRSQILAIAAVETPEAGAKSEPPDPHAWPDLEEIA